ncbi:hypothetical protein Baya_0820 [Bagarius yarrelli]|uniref:Uncharacterized protein n=1 Tax=Bagarius yarrelli TaxID=175774 RepID=A0A556TJB9_BAGYA|nr:hypothetical protein Baya_0820 [Bagarius yarrelli]
MGPLPSGIPRTALYAEPQLWQDPCFWNSPSDLPERFRRYVPSSTTRAVFFRQRKKEDAMCLSASKKDDCVDTDCDFSSGKGNLDLQDELVLLFKPCTLMAHLIGKAYAFSREKAAALHAMAIMQVFQT